MSRQITIPTTYKLADLEARIGPEQAKKIFEQIWLAEHPGAVTVLKNPLTDEQLRMAEKFVHGQATGRGAYQGIAAVLQKAFLVDERLASIVLAFIADERNSDNQNGASETPMAETELVRYNKRGRRISTKPRPPLTPEQFAERSRRTKERWDKAKAAGYNGGHLPRKEDINGK